METINNCKQQLKHKHTQKHTQKRTHSIFAGFLFLVKQPAIFFLPQQLTLSKLKYETVCSNVLKEGEGSPFWSKTALSLGQSASGYVAMIS